MVIWKSKRREKAIHAQKKRRRKKMLQKDQRHAEATGCDLNSNIPRDKKQCEGAEG